MFGASEDDHAPKEGIVLFDIVQYPGYKAIRLLYPQESL
jgi:hypothetical protein